MASTRVRFTISYVALAMGAVGAFAIALYVARLKLAEDQLYSQAIQTADDIVRDIQLSRERGYPLLVVDSTDPGSATISPQLRQYLDLRPGYFILIGANATRLYNSIQVRQLPPQDGVALVQAAGGVSPQTIAKVTLVADSLNEHKIYVLARSAGPGLEPVLSRVIVGIPDQYTELSGQLVLGTAFVILPFVLVAAGILAWGRHGASKVHQPLPRRHVSAVTGHVPSSPEISACPVDTVTVWWAWP